MRRLFVWMLGLAAALQVLMVAEATQQYVRLSLSQVGTNGKTVASVNPIATLELNMTNNMIQVLSWTVIGLVGAIVLAGFVQRARTALIGVATAGFGVVLFFAGFLPQSHSDALIALGIAAVVAAGASALLEWRGVAFYKKVPAAVPERAPIHVDEPVR